MKVAEEMYMNQRRHIFISWIYADDTFSLLSLTLPVPAGATTYTTCADAIVMIESLVVSAQTLYEVRFPGTVDKTYR